MPNGYLKVLAGEPKSRIGGVERNREGSSDLGDWVPVEIVHDQDTPAIEDHDVQRFENELTRLFLGEVLIR